MTTKSMIIQYLPDELIHHILDMLNDDELIIQLNVPEFRAQIINLLKRRLDTLSIENIWNLRIFYFSLN